MVRPGVPSMSGRRRFFVGEISYPERSEVTLEGDEFVHAKVVQRVEVGTEIVLLDGSGKEYTAIVSNIEKRRLTAHVTGAAVGDKEPKADIYLLFGALKGDKTELVVQKAVELGAAQIGVFASSYCTAAVGDGKLERLNKIAREAAKQCMRSRAPKVCLFSSLSDALKSAEGFQNKFFACEFASQSDADLMQICGSAALVIGSEGGFSEEEAALSKTFGFSQISLGKRILRAETAAIALMALAARALGELG